MQVLTNGIEIIIMETNNEYLNISLCTNGTEDLSASFIGMVQFNKKVGCMDYCQKGDKMYNV